LLGSVSGELGLRKFIESQGHELIVTTDKDGPNSVFERELPDAEVVISQPFWPAYLTAERIAKAPKLKLAITLSTERRVGRARCGAVRYPHLSGKGTRRYLWPPQHNTTYHLVQCLLRRGRGCTVRRAGGPGSSTGDGPLGIGSGP
jgi:hypothetical protein